MEHQQYCQSNVQVNRKLLPNIKCWSHRK